MHDLFRGGWGPSIGFLQPCSIDIAMLKPMSPEFWGLVDSRSTTTPAMLQLLTRVRRGDALPSISVDYPELNAAQISLAQMLQAHEAELNRLYADIQRLEQRKMQLEREFTTSLLKSPFTAVADARQ
jgi:hypothetical protein